MRLPDWTKTATDLLFPRRCPFCDRPVKPFGALCCDACAGVPVPVGASFCRKCGKPVEDETVYCEDCRRTEHLFENGVSVFRYRSVSGSLYRFKYEGRREYADYYGVRMAERFTEAVSDGTFAHIPDLLVPVPVSPKRMRARGYNQAELLARAMAGSLAPKWQIPVENKALQRQIETTAMRSMSAQARQNNLKKAFHVYGNSVRLKSIMLIDDIYTTGATIDACARALLEAGAGEVRFVTLAIGG